MKGYIPKVGEKIRLRTPHGKEKYNISWGSDSAKIKYMDEKTVYTVGRIQSLRTKGGTKRIWLNGVRSGGINWSWNEHWILPEPIDVTDKVHNTLKGLKI